MHCLAFLRCSIFLFDVVTIILSQLIEKYNVDLAAIYSTLEASSLLLRGQGLLYHVEILCKFSYCILYSSDTKLQCIADELLIL